MFDLMAEGYRLWGIDPKSHERTLAEVADSAENQQPRDFQLADELRMTCGFTADCGNPQQGPPPNPQLPQPIRNRSATANPHGVGLSAESATSAAPARPEMRSAAPPHEIERIIAVLTREVGRDLGTELSTLMRRAMGPLDRDTRAALAAEIDDAFEAAQNVRQAREQAALAIRGRVGTPPPATLDDWLEWVKARCPINADDRKHLASSLRWMAPAKLATTCRWYVQAWAKAAAAEPKSHRKDNAGRRAANQTLLSLVGSTPRRPMATGSTRQPVTATEPPNLPAGVKMAWTLRVDGRRLVLAGVAYTREQAQQAAQARWPGADVEVMDD